MKKTSSGDMGRSPHLTSWPDPPIPEVSFIAGRFSFRATERGSRIAQRALSKLKGLSLSSYPKRNMAKRSDTCMENCSATHDAEDAGARNSLG
jgi:hypothetical protein